MENNICFSLRYRGRQKDLHTDLQRLSDYYTRTGLQGTISINDLVVNAIIDFIARPENQKALRDHRRANRRAIKKRISN